jgi:hypothetical protein
VIWLGMHRIPERHIASNVNIIADYLGVRDEMRVSRY